jgi:sialidase-1
MLLNVISNDQQQRARHARDKMSVVRYAAFFLPLLLFATLAWLPTAAADVPYVIFEDDYDSDSDGPAALCMLLELEAAGECQIIACGTCELHEDSTATVAATLHYFGRGDIPLGSYRDDLRPYDPETTQLYDESMFCEFIAADEFNYGHTRRHRRDYPDAVEVYAAALNALPPGAKAKLILGGAHNNLRALLQDYPDLVRTRVSELHFMGGMIPPDAPEEQWHVDSNLRSTRIDTKYIAENWPPEIPVYIADTYLGLKVPFCRPEVRAQLSDLHPANRIHLLFRLGRQAPHGNALDLMSVLTAVRGLKNLNGVDLIEHRGTLQVNGQRGKDWGKHRFIASPDGPHTLLRRPPDDATAGKLADLIDQILLLRGGDAGDGVDRDEFVAERGNNRSETLQTHRGWIAAGAADSATLIDATGPLYDSAARYVQFNGNSSTAPYNVQVRDFGLKDVRVRARVMVTHPDGYAGLCVRSDAGENALGLNLRIQPGVRGLRLYDNDQPLRHTPFQEPAHEFALNTWYTLDLQVHGDRLIGRLCSDENGRTVLEQIQVTLPSVGDRRHAGLIARGNGERASWFQQGVRQSAEVSQTVLFEEDTDGFKLYRIPGIVVTARGTVLAYCEARKFSGADRGEIEIHLRRSTDGGHTWSPVTQVAHLGPRLPRNTYLPPGKQGKDFGGPDEQTVNNPMAIAARDGSVHLVYCVEYMRAFHIRSDDDGQTWTAPREITSAFEPLRKVVDWTVIATGPGHGIQLTSGRLVIPFWMNDYRQQTRSSKAAAVIYSDDLGQTWQAGEIAIPQGGEPNIAQLSDGSVIVTARNTDAKNRRIFATSPDGATNWTRPAFINEILEPGCMGAVVVHPGDVNKGTRPWLLYSAPYATSRSHQDRRDVTIYASQDDGKTWPIRKRLHQGPSAYSDLAVLPDGQILCFYERGVEKRFGDRGRPWAYRYLTLARFDLAWLVEPEELLQD